MAVGLYPPRTFDWKDSEGFIYRQDKISSQWWIEVGGRWYHYKKDFRPHDPVYELYQNGFIHRDDIRWDSDYSIQYSREFPYDSQYVFTHELNSGQGALIGYDYGTRREIYRHEPRNMKHNSKWIDNNEYTVRVYGGAGTTYTVGGGGGAGSGSYAAVDIASTTKAYGSMPATKKRPLNRLDNELEKTRRKARGLLDAI